MLEADPDLERDMTICQDMKKKLTPYCKLNDKKKSTVQRILVKFFCSKNLDNFFYKK